jgi:hypothetical protein
MNAMNLRHQSERYTRLSDRFRSLWTFYQFLGGLFKHQGRGALPQTYDFQELHRRLQDLVPQMGLETTPALEHELQEMSRQLAKIHHGLREVEKEFPPSLLRRFFDHLKRQDEKILVALVKFYLQSEEIDNDTQDKLDILLTRLAETPMEDGRALPRDAAEVRPLFARLATYVDTLGANQTELAALSSAVRDFRAELENVQDFGTLLTCGVYDRYRDFKHHLGSTYFLPEILCEITTTNIMARNRFQELYEAEETRILEDTNRIFEIERYLERHPDFAHPDLRRHIEAFRRFRIRFDAGRKEDNIKREDLLELRRSIHAVLERFDPTERHPVEVVPTMTEPASHPLPPPPDQTPVPSVAAVGGVAEIALESTPVAHELLSEPETAVASLGEMLPSDPLLNEALHKIMFSLELVAWDHPPEQAIHAKELHNLHLEPWEVEAYRKLSERLVDVGTFDWELDCFYLTSAALRVKMEEEAVEITRLNQSNGSDRLYELLERAAQSLERAREMDRRFQWFIDDMLYRGETAHLEQIYRSRFRFLNVFSHLWLEHQRSGGITPL